MDTKRKYTKRDCSYWGHDNKVIGKGSLDGAGVTLLQCKRCNARTWSKGVTDTELKDLISMTLKDMPTHQTLYDYIDSTHRHARYMQKKNWIVPRSKPIKRRWWNLWRFWSKNK